MILEGIVTTLNEEGRANIAPMGPDVGPGMARFVLRPFKTASTYHEFEAAWRGGFARDR